MGNLPSFKAFALNLSFIFYFLFGASVSFSQDVNAPYENALKSYYQKEYSAAVIYLKNALRENPEHLPSRILMAEILIEQGDGAGAEIELEFAQQKKADDKKILPLMLEAYLLQNKFDDVIANAVEIYGNNRLSSDVLVFKGRAFFAKNNVSLAQSEYRKAYELNNQNADAVMGMAQVAYKRKQYGQALELLEQTLVLSPDYINANQMKASIYQIQGKIDLASAAISDVVAIDAKHFPALLTRAGIYIEQQKYSLALADVEVILAEIPNEPRANYLKVVTTQALGMTEEMKATAAHLDIVLSGIPSEIMNENPIYYYLAGLVNYNHGEYIKAQDSLRDYVGLVDNDVRGLKLIAKVDFELEEFYSAKNYLVKARLLNPDDIEIWSLLGKAYFLTGDIEKAERYYLDVAEALPNSLNALVDLAKLQLAKGQSADAISTLLKAKKLDESNGNVTYQLAKAYQANNQPEKALELITSLLSTDTNNSYLYQQKGILHGALKQHDEAEKSFKQAYELNSNNIEALVHLARIDLVKGDVVSARKKLQDKLEVIPNNARLLVELGDTYTSKADIDKAQLYYEKAYSVNRSSSSAAEKLLDVLSVKGELAQAIDIATEYLTRNNDDSALHQRLAELYIQTNNYGEATKSFQLAIKHSNDKSTVLSEYAANQLKMRDRDGAILSLQKSIAWNQDFLSSYFQLIELYSENKDEEKALAVIALLERKLNFTPLTLALKGDVYFQVGKPAQSVKFFKESLAIESSQKATLGLSRALTAQGKLREAIALLNNKYKQQPQNTILAIALADVYVLNDEHSKAARIYDVQIASRGELPVLLNNAALINIELQNYDVALDYAQKAYSRVPTNVSIIDTLAWVYTKGNQPELALPLFRDALAIESDSAEIKYHLAVNLSLLKRNNEALRYLKEAIDSGQQFNGLNKAKALFEQLVN